MDFWLAPVTYVTLLWFFATGAVLWLNRQPADSWAGSLLVATALSGAAFGVVLISREISGSMAVYAGFAAALLLWAWHEMSFLMGFVTGPRRTGLPTGATGWRRFRLATAALIHHEVALALTAIALILVSWGHPNPIAAQVFLLLFALRLSTKINIFLGVPHFHDEMLPGHLDYLRSYYGAARTNPLLPVSAVAVTVLTVALAIGAIRADGDVAATSLALLAVLAGLGIVEHMFLLLPVRDNLLWRWAMKARTNVKGSVNGL